MTLGNSNSSLATTVLTKKILTLSDMNFQFSMKKIVECTNKFVTSYCSDDAIWNCCSRTTLSSYGLEI